MTRQSGAAMRTCVVLLALSVVFAIADPTLVILDNQDDQAKDTFRVRNDKGGIVEQTVQQVKGALIRDIPFTASRRTFYKSAYSQKRNIPITAVLTFEGNAIGSIDHTAAGVDGTNGKLVFHKDKLQRADQFVSDMREKVRPTKWHGKDPTQNAKYGDERKVPTGTLLDYTSPLKYNVDKKKYPTEDRYQNGHLISSNLFRTYFMKERYDKANPANNADIDRDIPYDYSQYMTNIFPQVGPSNNQNDVTLDEQTLDWTGNFDNWHANEIHEENAMQICFEKDISNKFHIAHGTIPTGKPENILQNTSWEEDNVNKKLNGPTNVNIPRYFYMAFCCSGGPYSFRKTFGDGISMVKTTQYALFEQFIPERPTSPLTADKGDKIERFDDASKLQDKIKQLWKEEHPNEKPFLFSEDPGVLPCPGFNVNI